MANPTTLLGRYVLTLSDSFNGRVEKVPKLGGTGFMGSLRGAFTKEFDGRLREVRIVVEDGTGVWSSDMEVAGNG